MEDVLDRTECRGEIQNNSGDYDDGKNQSRSIFLTYQYHELKLHNIRTCQNNPARRSSGKMEERLTV